MMMETQKAAQAPDYRLDGPRGREAAGRGLVSAEWHRCTVDRRLMKQLMQRDDRKGLMWLGPWVLLLGLAGALAWAALGTAWAVPAFLLYGILYSVSDHAAHELSHGTPLRTPWLNRIFDRLASFMTLHEPVYWRWSHARHHTDTLIVGRDREIAFPRPFSLRDLLLDVFFLKSGLTEIARTVAHACGRVDAATRSFVPEHEIGRMVRSSRGHALAFAAVIGACAVTASLVPLLFVIGPRFYGGQLALVFNITQHAGLPEDVLDHRLNCRSIRLHPLLGWLYMNMQYHLEHHMFPMVPLHALPALHEAIRDQCPPPYRGLAEVYREIVPAVLRQRRDPDHHAARPVPAAMR